MKLSNPWVWGRAPTSGIEDKLTKGYPDALLAATTGTIYMMKPLYIKSKKIERK